MNWMTSVLAFKIIGTKSALEFWTMSPLKVIVFFLPFLTLFLPPPPIISYLFFPPIPASFYNSFPYTHKHIHIGRWPWTRYRVSEYLQEPRFVCTYLCCPVSSNRGSVTGWSPIQGNPTAPVSKDVKILPVKAVGPRRRRLQKTLLIFISCTKLQCCQLICYICTFILAAGRNESKSLANVNVLVLINAFSSFDRDFLFSLIKQIHEISGNYRNAF